MHVILYVIVYIYIGQIWNSGNGLRGAGRFGGCGLPPTRATVGDMREVNPVDKPLFTRMDAQGSRQAFRVPPGKPEGLPRQDPGIYKAGGPALENNDAPPQCRARRHPNRSEPLILEKELCA